MIWDQDAVLDQELDSLIIQCDLAMAGKMFEMRLNNRCTLPDDIFHDRLLMVGTASRSMTLIAPSGQVPMQAPRPSQKRSLTSRAFPSIR